MKKFYEIISELRKSNIKAAICTIISASGSTPRKAGAKMLVTEKGKIFGTVGGGSIEKKTIECAIEAIGKNIPILHKFELVKDLGMACGGSVEVFIEPLYSGNRLYVFGAGHVGKAVAEHAINLDFDIYLIDDRVNIFEDWKKDGCQLISLNHKDFLTKYPTDNSTFIVIVSYSHEIDREILKSCIKVPFAYLGVIGSKRKTAETKKYFTDNGLATPNELDKIDMPIGLEIDAEGPDEIAISIIAKLIKVKNNIVLKSDVSI